MVGSIFKIGRCLRFSPSCRSISDSAAADGSSLLASAIIRSNPYRRAYPPPYNYVFKKIFNGIDHSPAVSSSRFSTSFSSFSVSNLGLVKWYLRMVKDHPVLTKSVTAALIYTAADLSSQLITRPSSEQRFDIVRTMRMAGYGMLVLGPSLHLWFNFVSRVFPKRDVKSTLKKILMAQTLYGPAMTSIFLSLNAGLKGENASEIMARLRRDLVPTMINGVVYWPFCDFLTFRFIPVQLQPLVSNSFSYLWTIYMTYMAGLEKPELTLAET